MFLSSHSNETLKGNVGLVSLKHCLEINSDEQPNKRICGPFRRIPCRARSLSNDHNGDTAYFDIPCDAPHGLPLNCSHEECIKSGRRFRYCKVCELPVAKRNFVKRHGHNMVYSSKELKETVDRLVHGTRMKKTLPVVPMDSSVGSSSFTRDDDSLDGLDLLCHDFSRAVTPLPCHELKSDFERSERMGLSSQHDGPVSFCQTSLGTGCHVEYLPSQQPQIYVVVPPSPPTQACILSPSIDGLLQLSSLKVVPLVEPGSTITESEFADAIQGIDFAKVFD